VTWTDHFEASLLRDALKAHKIENVMLVSAFMAAAALAQAIGDATNYTHTALLFVEPYTATLAVVDNADGSISDVHQRLLADDEDQAVAELAEMASNAESLEARPNGVVVVGSGVDIPLIKPALEAATSLDLSVPDEPEMALARGAALASANAPLFGSPTTSMAYALDPGTGEVDPLELCLPEHHGIPDSFTLDPDVAAGKPNIAYSALADDDPEERPPVGLNERAGQRSILLVGSMLAVVFITTAVALVALAVSIRPSVALRPSPGHNVVIPAKPAPLPPPDLVAPQIQVPAPAAVPDPIGPPADIPAPVPDPPIAPAPRGPFGWGPWGPHGFHGHGFGHFKHFGRW